MKVLNKNEAFANAIKARPSDLLDQYADAVFDEIMKKINRESNKGAFVYRKYVSIKSKIDITESELKEVSAKVQERLRELGYDRSVSGANSKPHKWFFGLFTWYEHYYYCGISWERK